MMTFYDFLEQFLAQGCLSEDDLVLAEFQTIDQRTPDGKFKSPTGSQPKTFYTPSPQESHQNRIGFGSQSISPVSREHNNQLGNTPQRTIAVKDLDHKMKNQLLETVVSYALQIAHELGKDYLTDSWRQREVAYLVICLARSFSHTKKPDSKLLKTLYMVDQDEDFSLIQQGLLADFSVISPEDYDFDPVERKYDAEGNLISDFGKKRNQKKRQVYKGKIDFQTDINPLEATSQ